MRLPFLRDLRIRARLLLLCFAVALPLLAMCGLVVARWYQGLNQTAQHTTTFQDAIAVRSLSQWIASESHQLTALAYLSEIQHPQEPDTRQILTTQSRLCQDWQALGLFDLHGQLICAGGDRSRSTANINLAGQDYFKAACSTAKAQISGFATCPFTGRPAVIMAQPVTARGKITGVLVASVRPLSILRLFAGLGEAHGSVICVIDQHNRVIARTLEYDRFLGQDFSHARTVTAAGHKTRGVIEAVGICDPVRRTYAFDREPTSGWLVILGVPTQVLYGSEFDRLMLMVLCAVLALGLSVALAYAFTRHFTGPIYDLVREAVSIGRGDLGKRVTITEGGELGLLARAFNEMALNLQINVEHKEMVERISEQIRQSLDLERILNTTVLELGKALSASRCCLAMIQSDGAGKVSGCPLEFDYLFWSAERGGTPLKNRQVIITEDSILKMILEQGAILSLDMMDDSTFTPLFEKAEESPEDWRSIKSLIACPIILNQQPIGMILVHQCDFRRVWYEPELDLVEAVARHVALAVEHARLFERAKRQAEQESLINHIVRSTRTSLCPETILATASTELGRALGVDYCQIAQPRPEGPLVVTHEYHAPGLTPHIGLSLYGQKLDFRPSSETDTEVRQVLGIDLSELGMRVGEGRTLKEAPIAVISDVKTDRRVAAYQEFLETVGTQSLIAAPLLRDDRLLGILIVHQVASQREWTGSDMRLLAAVGDQLSVAVSHAQLFEQVQYQAITDGLTGLYNHVYFKNRLSEEINRSQRKNVPCSLIMIDMDRLKQINDNYGHPIGDAAIRQIAHALKTLLRSGDSAARYGGEEFAVILPETTIQEANIIAERLRLFIHRNPVPVLGHISASMGVAVFPNQAAGLDELVERADQALYVAKRSGRNRVCVWDDALSQVWAAEVLTPPASAEKILEEEKLTLDQ